MDLKEVVKRLEEIERKKAAKEYDYSPPMITDVERLRLDIEMYLLKTTGTL
jgi:hypothetical protein